ncbi:MAG: HD domain-containing phosphohydrolase, partial [Bacillota bacterium]
RVIAETAQLLLVRSGDDMLKMFCQQALTAFNCTQCVLFLASEDRTRLETRAVALQEGVSHADFLYVDSFPVDSGLTGWVFLTGEPVHSNDVANDPRAYVRNTYTPSSGIFLPVVDGQGLPMGVLRLYKPGIDGFSQEDFDLAKLWAMEVGLVLQKAELHRRMERMALTDALTGTYNRHYLSQRWPAIVESSTSEGLSVALLMLDCFNFKQINDRYGHTVGDTLLQSLGQLLLQETPETGFVVRYGGDEFLVVLPNTTQHQAAELRQVLERRLSLGAVTAPDGPFLTVDIGLYAAEGGELLQLLTRVDSDLYEERDQASYQRLQALLEHSVSERTKHMVQAVMSLTKIQELNDPYTRGHSERSKEIAVRTARRLGMTPEEVQVVGFGAILHDVGKVVVPPEILKKPGPLSEEEWRIMRLHPVFGTSIVGELDVLKPVKPLILHHHERFDGRTDGKHPGYPAGLSAEQIPLGARIIAVVDAFDAMISDRVYRKGMSVDSAMAELRRMAGTQFDPTVVDAVAAVVQEMLAESYFQLQAAAAPGLKPGRRAIGATD